MALKPRVLVVEDDAEIGEVLRRSLRLEGYDVRIAGDGVAALDEATVFEPDAVVLDLGLPRLDGVEVARRLRADGGARDPPHGASPALSRPEARNRPLCWDSMSESPRVLVVEDDTDIAGVLRRQLDKEGYQVRVAADGEEALEESSLFEPDAVVLDLGLPRLDGVEVARRLRAGGDVPILILTARDALESRVEGLDSGADDYLVKPFEREELLARIRALLRRRPPRGSASLVVGDLRLNPSTREAHRGERELELTAREFELLEHLMRNERIVVSRQALLDEVWGYDPFAETNTVDVFISNLRRKLEAGGEPRLLHTVRGAGYVMKAA